MTIIKISDGNAFKLRVTALVNSAPANFDVVTNMIVNFVRRGRLAQPHGIDISGRLVISNDGSLARGIYGVEITGYYEGIPNSLRMLLKGSGENHQVFGVKTAFNRKGDNWFEVYPTKDGKAYEIPFIGDVSTIDFWVWGANYNYTLEVLVRDALGRIHVLQAGNLAFKGWKNLIINVPGYIQQHSHLRSGPENLTLVGFRVRSDAEEYVDNYVIFFDQLKYTSNSLSYIYDGYELNEVDFGDSDSSSNGNSSNKSKSSNSRRLNSDDDVVDVGDAK